MHQTSYNTESLIEVVRGHRRELAELGILSLSIFGSMARDEAGATSDVDLAVTLTPGERGFAHLERMDHLREQIRLLLGRPVDLVEEPARSPRVQRAIEQDRIRAF